MATEGQSPRPGRLLSVRDLAEMLRISRQTVYSLINSGELPKAIRVGARRRWRLADIERWLETTRHVHRRPARQPRTVQPEEPEADTRSEPTE